MDRGFNRIVELGISILANSLGEKDLLDVIKKVTKYRTDLDVEYCKKRAKNALRISIPIPYKDLIYALTLICVELDYKDIGRLVEEICAPALINPGSRYFFGSRAKDFEEKDDPYNKVDYSEGILYDVEQTMLKNHLL